MKPIWSVQYNPQDWRFDVCSTETTNFKHSKTYHQPRSVGWIYPSDTGYTWRQRWKARLNSGDLEIVKLLLEKLPGVHNNQVYRYVLEGKKLIKKRCYKCDA